jgi:hypothetical protein
MRQRPASVSTSSSIAPRITPSSSSVLLARRARGGLNSGTPLAIASTPVSALQPAENAFSSSSRPTGSTARAGSNERLSGAACSASGWIRPMAKMASSPTMKTIVGSRNARAASPRPRRLSRVITARTARQIGTVAGLTPGKAEVSAAVPPRWGPRR